MDAELFEERKKIVLDIISSPHYVPMKAKELAMVLNVKKEDREELNEVLDALLSDGKIMVTKRGKYKKPDSDHVIGTFERHEKGFGFVTSECMEEDIYIAESETNGAMNEDTVEVAIHKGSSGVKRAEGTIIRIITHGVDEVVGLYQDCKNYGFVVCDRKKVSPDIFIPKGKSMGAVNGHKVVVKLTDYGGNNKKPEGEVIEIIGHVNDPGTDILSIVKDLKIPMEYPNSVMEYVEKNIPDEVPEEEKVNREDFRNIMMVTIDGEDAKDLDDAVSLEIQGNEYVLGVHIADVSNYVTENSVLDKEALKRSTSVYLVDRVIPMIPHKLSNGICSLNEGEDRLALSVIMRIDKKGNVISHKICESVVNIDKRMDYTTVNKIIEFGDPVAINENKELVPMLQKMNELALILRSKRHQQGSIDFEFPESKIILDEKGHPVDILPHERNLATKLIEDFMLIANETVAEEYYWLELPFVYRIHESPDPEKIQKLATFIANFGYGIKTDKEEVHPKEIQKLLTKLEGTSEEALISRLTLRSMKQAKYSTICSGHFGLAFKYYCHYTSPIRRYPDLQIHRIIKENLRGNLTEKRIRHYESILPGVAEQTSKCERRADEAERDTDKLKMVEYMSDHIGEDFTGVISSITNWGMYVELPNTVEGLIHVNNMTDDYYYYDEEKYQMIGQESKKEFKLGQKIDVTVLGTDKERMTIDFVIKGMEGTS